MNKKVPTWVKYPLYGLVAILLAMLMYMLAGCSPTNDVTDNIYIANLYTTNSTGWGKVLPGAGAQGLQGEKGDTGLTGLQGEKGDTGNSGFGQGCRVYNTTNILVASGPNVPLTFDSEHYDIDGEHSTTSNTGYLYATVSGEYVIGITVRWNANATGMRETTIRDKNGDLLARTDQNTIISGGFGQNVTTIWHLNAGDFVQSWVYQDSGVSINITANSYFSPEFYMQRIGY